jgi:hypothetical protein
VAHFEFSVQYSEDLVRRSVRWHFAWLMRRELTWPLWLAVIATAATLVGYGLLHGRASWIEGVSAGVLLLLPMNLIVGYRAHLSQGLGKLRTMGTENPRFILTDVALTVSASSGSITIPWNQFVGISKGPDFWILRARNRATLTLPTEDVDVSALDFLETIIRTADSVV